MKNIIVAIVVLVLIGGIWFLLRSTPKETEMPEQKVAEEVELRTEEIIEKEITVPLGEGATDPEIKVMIKIGIKELEFGIKYLVEMDMVNRLIMVLNLHLQTNSP